MACSDVQNINVWCKQHGPVLLVASSRMIMYHNAKVISDWFMSKTMVLDLLSYGVRIQWNSLGYGRIGDSQHLKNLQELRDAVMSTWTRISKECFQHLVQCKN